MHENTFRTGIGFDEGVFGLAVVNRPVFQMSPVIVSDDANLFLGFLSTAVGAEPRCCMPGSNWQANQ